MRYLTLVIIMTFGFNAFSQCSDDLADATFDRLADYTYLKEMSVTIAKKSAVQKHYLIFNKGIKYKFAAQSDAELKPVFNLYTASNKLIATNYDDETNTVYDVFKYTAKQSGEFYVTLSFASKAEGCIIGMVGFLEN